MTATITSLKFQGLQGSVVRHCAAVFSMIALLALTTSAQAATIYADGDSINLATGRSNTFSSSGNAGGVITGPVRLSYNPIRYDAANSVDGPYWQVNFPTGYQVSNVFVDTLAAPYRILTMNVQTTTDGVNWITQASPAVAGDILSATFTPVSGVTGVRLVSTSYDTALYPGIFEQIRITGPNDALPLYLNGQTEFNINSAIWNNGIVQSQSGWAPLNGGGSLIAPIDDATIEPFIYNKIIFSTTDANPAPIDILLDQNYSIDSVAITTGNETAATDVLLGQPGGRTATHVDISYSSTVGGAFTPILTNIPLLGSPDGHYEIDLGGMFDARRIRYDFSHPLSTRNETFIAELYAYAVEPVVPAPEPSSMLLLGAGLGLLAMKRRRQNKTAHASQA